MYQNTVKNFFKINNINLHYLCKLKYYKYLNYIKYKICVLQSAVMFMCLLRKTSLLHLLI